LIVDHGGLSARRIGALYLGVALLCFVVRSTTSAGLMNSVSLFAVLVNTLLAGLGLAEYGARRTGPAILVSVAVEILLLIGFGRRLLTSAAGARSTELCAPMRFYSGIRWPGVARESVQRRSRHKRCRSRAATRIRATAGT
jgi:hypothetical protein